MKLDPSESRHGTSVSRLALTLVAAALFPLILYAAAPVWWAERGVLVPGAGANDYAPVNQGQLKNIARAAVKEMDAQLPGGAGDILHTLVDAWASPTAQTNDFAPVNLGQLKNIAKPFYDRLIAVGLTGSYPWSGNHNQPDDFALANIGQVKKIFSFDLPNPLYDGDGNGLPDAWERKHFGQTGVDPNADPDGDGLTNLQEYQNATDPHDYYNGNSFDLDIVSGNGQHVSPGAWLPQLLVVQVTNGVGAALSNAPVTFLVTPSGGALSVASGGTQVSSVECRTDATGKAHVYYQAPATEGLAVITAQTQSVGYVKQVSFTASTIDANLPFVGLRLWLRGDAGVVKDASNAVSQWIDGTGNGNDAIQNSTSSSPVYMPNALNGRPVVHFDGIDDSLNLPNFASGFLEGEAFVVLKSQGPVAGQTNTLWTMGDDYIWSPNTYPGGDGTVYETFGTRTQKATGKPSQALDQFHLYDLSSKADEFVTRINGREHFRATSNTVFFPAAPILGGGVYGGHRFGGDIAEVLIFNRVLTQAERNAVDLYLNQKYLFVAAAPPVPDQFRAWPLNSTQVSLSWISPVSNAVTFYEMQRRVSTGNFETIATVTNGMSYIDSSASLGTAYTYRVVARNGAGGSGPSTEVNVTTLAGGTLMPLSEIKLWLKADEGVAKNRANIWTDSSGNQQHAIQVTPSSQPQVIESAINGRPVVRFDGLDDSLTLADFANGFTQGEVFAVVKSQGPVAGQTNTLWTMGDDYIWTPNTYPGGDGTVCETFGTRNQKNTGVPSQPLNQTHLYNVSSKTGEFVTRFNGIEHYRTASNAVFFPAVSILGGGVYGGHRFGGDIAELIVFNRVLSQSERERVQSYLAEKYFIPGFDLDGDGLTNAEEQALGTDPRNADTNGDGISDGASVRLGINPLGPGYNWHLSPQPPANTPLNFTLSDPPGAVLLQ